MNQREFLELIDKYLQGKASEAEKTRLFSHYRRFRHSGTWDEEAMGNSKEVEARILAKLTAALSQKEAPAVVPLHRRPFFKIAAAVAVVLSAATIWWFANQQTQAGEDSRTKNNLAAGTHHTRLVLADGRSFTIDNADNGLLVQEGGVLVKKQGRKLLIEAAKAASRDAATPQYNTLITPKGQQCELLLADGTQVWLNAASSLQFPVAFLGQERTVQLSGEAYFEVAKNREKPFRVYSSPVNGPAKGAWVEVLGTHFNLNSYNDEAVIKATLLEGSVKVTAVNAADPRYNNAQVLTPGQQAQLSSHQSTMTTVDVDEAVAWRNNVFDFNNADIQSIMRQLARWYDVEVAYEGSVPVRTFSGKINRSETLSTVLKILEQSNIRFRMKGRQIIVHS